MKTTRLKRQFVNLIPKTSEAKDRFVNTMDSLHGMVVEKETADHLCLMSINECYYTRIPKSGNKHWEIVR